MKNLPEHTNHIYEIPLESRLKKQDYIITNTTLCSRNSSTLPCTTLKDPREGGGGGT